MCWSEANRAETGPADARRRGGTPPAEMLTPGDHARPQGEAKKRGGRFEAARENSVTVDVFVIWIMVGGATGLLASILLSRVPMGAVGSVIVGILGGVLGGLLFGLLNLPIAPGIFMNVGVAFLGSVALLAISQMLL